MKNNPPNYLVLCNNAEVPKKLNEKEFRKIHNLELSEKSDNQNIKTNLKKLLFRLFYLPDYVLDLLEIAAYIFSGDRASSRGSTDAVEYHSWSREFHFVIKVRDYEFWNRSEVKQKLNKALKFMTGDREYKFTFLPGRESDIDNLFNREDFKTNKSKEKTHVCLFSGGLDSLAGTVEILNNTKKNVYLVSHRSQPSIKRTQDKLIEKLKEYYPNRISHYTFQCHFKGKGSREESQRTRSFLYGAIAFAICKAHSLNHFYIYENGITSLNFSRREDLINARASRTTHPKTIGLLEELFCEIYNGDDNFKISLPFLWKTKADIIKSISKNGHNNLINSTVSCSKTYDKERQATHCGKCFQCIDRKFASYAVDLDNIDESGIYGFNFINTPIEDKKVKTSLVDYIRQAIDFVNSNEDKFYRDRMNDLVHITDYLPEKNELEAVKKIYNLCFKHGNQVRKAIKKMRSLYDNPTENLPKNSLLEIVSNREYLNEPIERLVKDICKKLKKSIPMAFQNNPPKNENDFNDKVSSILNAEKSKFEREYPSNSFALAKTIPDHAIPNELLIESKYIRGSTTPSKVTDGIAADIIKYNEGKHILFIVYDPEREISDDEVFKRDFEQNYNSTICIIR